MPFPLIHADTNGKRKKDEESSESEEEEAEDKTPKNKKTTTTPQTFPKANKKVRLKLPLIVFEKHLKPIHLMGNSNSFSPSTYPSVEL